MCQHWQNSFCECMPMRVRTHVFANVWVCEKEGQEEGESARRRGVGKVRLEEHLHKRSD